MKSVTVTIDGPAGAGKSTVSRRLAVALGYTYLDTGAIYRAVGLAVAQDEALAGRLAEAPSPEDLAPGDREALGQVARHLDMRFAENGTRVFLGGEDVSEAIRTPDAGERASRVSAVPEVRAALLDLQRQIGASGGVVAEGRDTGSVVFPSAEAKFFLTATVECRARRRAEDLRQRGIAADEASVAEEIAARDARDAGRAVAPLRCPEGGVEIDTTGVPIADVVDQLARLVRSREGA